MTPAEEIKSLRAKIAQAEAVINVARNLKNAERATVSAGDNLLKFEMMSSSLLNSANDVINQWIDWCEMGPEDYVKKYGVSEDSMVTVLENSKKYLHSDIVQYHAIIKDSMDKILSAVRRGVMRKQDGKKLALQVQLNAADQEIIVKAMDAFDKAKKEL